MPDKKDDLHQDRSKKKDKKNILWDEYFESKTEDVRNELAEYYLKFVRYIATQVERQLHIPEGMDREDLIQWGSFGLLSAIADFDRDKGGRFETYAAIRIRGKMIDHMRKHRQESGGMTRTIVDNIKKIEKVVNDLEVRNKKTPTAKEIAEELEITVEEYYRMVNDNTRHYPMSLDKRIGFDENMPAIEVIKNDKISNPEESFLEKERVQILDEAIEDLPENERNVIRLRYYEDMTLKEIGKKLKLSEPRISQLHKQALNRLEQKDLI